VDISVDGRSAGELAPGEAISATFVPEATDLAQVPGSSFYRRLREKFGRLAT
jgi:NAD+ kinase